MYNLRLIEKIIRCSLPIGNINGVDLFVAGIEVYLYPPPISYFGQSNALKSVLCVKKSAVS